MHLVGFIFKMWTGIIRNLNEDLLRVSTHRFSTMQSEIQFRNITIKVLECVFLGGCIVVSIESLGSTHARGLWFGLDPYVEWGRGLCRLLPSFPAVWV